MLDLFHWQMNKSREGTEIRVCSSYTIHVIPKMRECDPNAQEFQIYAERKQQFTYHITVCITINPFYQHRKMGFHAHLHT